MSQSPGDGPDAATVSTVVDLVLTRKPTCGSTRVVAVDGPAGSGKTTLGDAVADDLRRRNVSTVVHHLDDQYEGWTGLDGSLVVRLTEQVLAPLARHEPAHWQRYDWHADRFDGWESFDPPQVLVVEGCGSGATDYDAYNTVLVWVEAGAEERIRRGVARAGEQVLPQWTAWMVSEQAHFAENDTESRADLRLRTD